MLSKVDKLKWLSSEPSRTYSKVKSKVGRERGTSKRDNMILKPQAVSIG